MSNRPSAPDPAMEAAASLWAARLDGSPLSEEKQAELAQWLELNPLHRSLLSDYCQFSSDLENMLPVLLATGGVELPRQEKSGKSGLWKLWLSGLGIAALAAVTLGLWLSQPAEQYSNVATPVAERQTLALVDGSTVDLDARTSLRVEINGETRRVQLAEGQAFFAVAKDSTRPFVVETPVGAIRVKGTQFDVQTDWHHALTVTVLEGIVQISPSLAGDNLNPMQLRAGDQLTLNETGSSLRKLTKSDLDDTIAWRQGQIVFNGTLLSDALERIGRHHGVGITSSPAAAQQRLGGRFSLDDLNGFFNALEETLPVRVSRNLNGTVQVVMRDPTHGIRNRE